MGLIETNNQLDTMDKFIIQKIETLNKSDDKELVHRLYDLGLHPGLEIEVITRVSFGSVIIIQYGATRIALNEEEFSCLRGC